MLKPLVPNFRPDLFDRLGDIAEKQVPANLKSIVAARITDNADIQKKYILLMSPSEYSLTC